MVFFKKVSPEREIDGYVEVELWTLKAVGIFQQEGPARALIRALNLGQMEHARQPGAGWRGAKVLAQMLIHRAGKVFSSSADLFFVSRFCQQISLVSRFVFCQQIL